MNEQKQMDFLFEVFDASMPRLGPGDDASTQGALKTLLSAGLQASDRLRVLDLGCGNGAQTIQLARRLDGAILAVDFHQPYLDELRRRAEAEGLSGKIRTLLADMNELDFGKESFDLIWSEGALYNMGFHNGLAICYSLLVPGGLMAVTELTWLSSEPPDECKKFFAGGYPAMADINTNLAAIRACKYEVIEHFTLPESAWWDQYYNPLEKRLPSFREKYATDPERLEILESFQMEIDIYRKYSSYYGNVFYLMQR